MNNLNKLTLTSAFVLSALVPSQAFAATLVSTSVMGSSTPTITNAASVQNGDFTITSIWGNRVGDGEDEVTSWKFNFNSPSIIGNVTKALVDLDLKPLSLFETDTFEIAGIGSLQFTDFLPLNQAKYNQTQSVQIDLLKFFSPGTILTAFNNSGGSLQASYGDDAILSFAKMTLEAESVDVPEPATTFGLLTLVGLGSTFLAKRKS